MNNGNGFPRKNGVGDVARRQFREHHNATTAPRSTVQQISDLRVYIESKRIESISPFEAVYFRSANAASIDEANVVLGALQEAAPPGATVTPAQAIAFLEATQGAA